MLPSNTKVNEFLRETQANFSDSFETVDAIRTLFFKENNQLTDDIKYGGIVFYDADKLIGGIYLYKEHISIEFSQGTSFSDPSNLLEGKGKLRRHLKIQRFDDIQTKNAYFFIKRAVKGV